MDNLSCRLQEFIAKYKNYFSCISKPKNKELFAEVKNATSFLPETANTSQRIYHVLNENIPHQCQIGKDKKFYSMNKGYGSYNCCGKESVCECYRDHHSEVVKRFQAAKTPLEKAASNEIRRQTTLEKYGVEYIGQCEEAKEKIKETCLEKYGVDSTLKVLEIREKQKQTLIANYGVDNALKSSEIQLKSQETCLERYGVRFTGQTDQVKTSRKKTMIERYGKEHALQTEVFYEKRKATCMTNFGTENPQELICIKEKAVKTNIKRYGQHSTSQKHLHPDLCDILYNKEKLSMILSNMGWTYLIEKYSINSAIIRRACDRLKIPYDKQLYSGERLIYETLLELGLKEEEILIRDRKICKPRELDFYLPDYNLAIEVCGLYWHSERSGKKDKKYHVTKFQNCKDQNIRLITIFDDELAEKLNIVKKTLANYLGKNGKQKIYARNCVVKQVQMTEEKEFLKNNHIQGYSRSLVCFGLYYQDKLVSVLSFSRPRVFYKHKKTDDIINSYEIVRFCSAQSIPGAASKLLAHFVKIYSPKLVYTYADLRWGTGNVYEKLGFLKIGQTSPNYWYTRGYFTREYRFNFRKDILVKKHPEYSHLTEKEIMEKLRYDRIWDCGNYKYSMNYR